MRALRSLGPLSVCGAVLTLLPAGTGAAQQPGSAAVGEPVPAAYDSALEAQARALASRLRCPVCLNLSVEDSPSELARDMKRLIREMLAEGRSPAEVQGYFIDRYGEWVLLTPKPQGFNLVVWLLPAALLVLGGGIVWAAVKRWTGREVREAAEAAEEVEQQYLRRVREEIARGQLD